MPLFPQPFEKVGERVVLVEVFFPSRGVVGAWRDCLGSKCFRWAECVSGLLVTGKWDFNSYLKFICSRKPSTGGSFNYVLNIKVGGSTWTDDSRSYCYFLIICDINYAKRVQNITGNSSGYYSLNVSLLFVSIWDEMSGTVDPLIDLALAVYFWSTSLTMAPFGINKLVLN